MLFPRDAWTDAEAMQLAKALPSCHGLKELILDSNKIGGAGAEALAAALPSCHGSDNPISCVWYKNGISKTIKHSLDIVLNSFSFHWNN